jgi:type VI secretion system secreted protein Hcp
MAYSAFVQFEGIEATTYDPRYPGAARLIAFDQIMQQPTAGSAVAGGEATAGRVDHGDFNLVKAIDAASPILSLYCSSGAIVSKVTISVAEESEDLLPFYEFVLDRVLVRSIQPALKLEFGHANEAIAPYETISLRYQKVTWRYTFLDNDESGRGSIQHYWDLYKNRGS